MKFLTLTTTLVIANVAHAELIGSIELVGKVKSYDEKTVRLDSDGTTITIPREIVKTKLKVGDEVAIPVSRENESKIAFK